MGLWLATLAEYFYSNHILHIFTMIWMQLIMQSVSFFFFFFLGGGGDLIFNSFVTGGLLCYYTSPL